MYSNFDFDSLERFRFQLLNSHFDFRFRFPFYFDLEFLNSHIRLMIFDPHFQFRLMSAIVKFLIPMRHGLDAHFIACRPNYLIVPTIRTAHCTHRSYTSLERSTNSIPDFDSRFRFRFHFDFDHHASRTERTALQFAQII